MSVLDSATPEVTHPYLKTKNIRMQQQDRRVVLDGGVESYYEKQLAQELVKQLDGVEEIINRITVEWRSEANANADS